MTGSIALDVVIGLVFIYTLYSLLTTTLTELLASAIRLRPLFLAKGIRRMLDDGSGNTVFSDAFFRQPLIKYLASKDGRKPSYMAGRNFSKNLLEVLKAEGLTALKGKISATELEKIQAILNDPTHPLWKSETVGFIRSLLEDAQNDLEKFKLYLEQWYDDTMERVSTWYKRRIQIITFFIGLSIAILFNVDTIKIVNKLSKDPKARAQFVAMAQELAKDTAAMEMAYKSKHSFDSLASDFSTLRGQALESNDVLSINRGSIDGWSLLGWLITAVALSLGSPFWFDLLNKLVKLRTSTQPAAERRDSSTAQASQPLTADKREG